MIDTKFINDELKQHNIFRHFPTLLHRWYGQRALLFDLTTSLRKVRIRVSDSHDGAHLVVTCLDPFNMHGPFQFENSKIDIRCENNELCTVYDLENDFQLQCGWVEVAEFGTPEQT